MLTAGGINNQLGLGREKQSEAIKEELAEKCRARAGREAGGQSIGEGFDLGRAFWPAARDCAERSRESPKAEMPGGSGVRKTG